MARLAPGVSPDAVRKACAAPCSDRFTRVVVYRDTQGVARRYERESAPGPCSHSPTLFLDEHGVETGAIPLVPVAPGSDEARRYQAIREQQTGGLSKAETVSCGQVAGP